LKKLVYIVITVVFLLSSCGKSNFYEIEGELSNLSDPILYVVYESPEGAVFDTIQTDNKGYFSTVHEAIDDLQSVIIYYQDKERWFTIYPETGTLVKIKGDAQYPRLIQVRGGRINNKLGEYKSKVAALLKEQADRENKTEEASSTSGDSNHQSANITLQLQYIAQDFIKKNPKEKASAILISEYFSDPEENILQVEELLNILSPELNDFYIVKNFRSRIEKAKESIAGAKAPDFNVTNIYGQTFTPDSFLNKYYVLAFTALWCDLCQTEMMMLDRISAEYSKDSLEIMMISLDDDSKEVLELLERDTVKWNLVIDSAGQAIDLFDKYNVNTLPKCLLMDKEGIIILRTTNGVELKETVDKIFK
jgi:peroxiredoxin